MNSVDSIVNGTPLGTYPDTNQAPKLPYQFLNEQHLLFDLIYNPAKPFRGKRDRKGCQSVQRISNARISNRKILGLWNQ